MQKIKLPTADSGSLVVAQEKIPNKSPLYEKDTTTLYVKHNDKLNPIGNTEAFEKALASFYFVGRYDELMAWPIFDSHAVIYINKNSEIDGNSIHFGFWSNLGTLEEPDWRPFCNNGQGEKLKYFPVGTILKFAFNDEQIPEGYVKCDGSELFPSEAPDLFEAIQYNYGMGHFENNEISFNIPKLTSDAFIYIIKTTKTNFDFLNGTIYQSVNENIPNFEKAIFNEDNLIQYFFRESMKENNKGKNLNSDYLPYIINTGNSYEIPAGLIVFFPKGYLPKGFIKCDGGLVIQKDYLNLYATNNNRFGKTGDSFYLPFIESAYVDVAISIGETNYL